MTQVSSLWKIFGGILLIVGTSIGGGILVLPLATADCGFLPSASLLFGTWVMMTIGALLMLEVSLWLPAGTNLISMVEATLGKHTRYVTWFVYLLLLYFLLSAYIAAGEDLVTGLFGFAGIHIPANLGLLIFVGIFGTIVIMGIRSVDLINRIIMTVKMLSFLLMVVVTVPLVKHQMLLMTQDYQRVMGTMTVMLTAYGFAIIVPSLRSYFHDNINHLRTALVVGCAIPFVCYVVWESVIFGALPATGEYGLHNLANLPQPISGLLHALSDLTRAPWVTFVAQVFTSICVVTAFLTVSLCLADFLADGMGLKKQGKSGILINCLTFLPPLTFVIFIPKLFVLGISFAGVFCIIILILLPARMALSGLRQGKQVRYFTLFRHQAFLRVIILVSYLMLAWGIVLNVQDFVRQVT